MTKSNSLKIENSDRIAVNGVRNYRWDGAALSHPNNGQVIRFSAEVTEEINAAVAACRPAEVETAAELVNGTEDWERREVNTGRIISPALNATVYFAKSDLR